MSPSAVKDAKAGKVEYRVDKAGVVHCRVGRASFDAPKLAENALALVRELVQKKPSTAKGIYLRSITLSSTMGPGVRIDPDSVAGERGGSLMLRSRKEEEVEIIKDRFGRMTSAVFLNYAGMTVEEVSKLRDIFRDKGVEYKVVKNTLVKHALKDEPWMAELGKSLKGMTGVAWSYEEPSAAARIVKEFRQGHRQAPGESRASRRSGARREAGGEHPRDDAEQGRSSRDVARHDDGARTTHGDAVERSGEKLRRRARSKRTKRLTAEAHAEALDNNMKPWRRKRPGGL